MISIEPRRTALLVMDLQSDIVAMIGAKAAPLLERAASLVAAARRAAVPVLYVAVGFRPGYPELPPDNATMAAIAKTGRFLATSAADIAPEVVPQDGEVVVIKHRVSAFAGTDLDLILRAQRRDTLVLCGISTSGVVLSTVRAGADADYRLIVASDACTDADDEVHRVLTEKVFVRQATVAAAADIVVALAAA